LRGCELEEESIDALIEGIKLAAKMIK